MKRYERYNWTKKIVLNIIYGEYDMFGYADMVSMSSKEFDTIDEAINYINEIFIKETKDEFINKVSEVNYPISMIRTNLNTVDNTISDGKTIVLYQYDENHGTIQKSMKIETHFYNKKNEWMESEKGVV